MNRSRTFVPPLDTCNINYTVKCRVQYSTCQLYLMLYYFMQSTVLHMPAVLDAVLHVSAVLDAVLLYVEYSTVLHVPAVLDAVLHVSAVLDAVLLYVEYSTTRASCTWCFTARVSCTWCCTTLCRVPYYTCQLYLMLYYFM